MKRFFPAFHFRFLLSFFFAAPLGLLVLFSACKSQPVPPPPEEEASAFLLFEDIKAEDPDHLILDFSGYIENPVLSGGTAKIESWRVEINGKGFDSGMSLDYPESVTIGRGQYSFPLTLNLDISALAKEGFIRPDEYEVNLITEMIFDFDSAPGANVSASGLASFPGIKAPLFTITAIAILKAELVNTRFRVALKIENPNPFPVELSSLVYKLYGNGRLWAEDGERDIIRVNGRSSVEGNLFLVMNFINMKRDLLDQIIRLEDVNYRFTGEAQVSTGIEYLPKFHNAFDLSGYSKVYEN